MSQTERILYLDKRMREVGRVTAEETANRFEVSTRQVKRDIEYLRDRFDAPIVYDKSIRAYCYGKKFTDLEFADQNIIMSYLALQSFASNHQYMPIYTENMMSAINEEIPSDYRSICKKITYQIQQYDAIKPDYFEAICSSMRDNKCLSTVYTNADGGESSRLIEPHHIINYNGSWYIIAFDRKKEKLLTFLLSRFNTLSLTNTKFIKHDECFKKSLSDLVNNGFGIFHGSKTQLVKIRFYNKAAHIVSTQIWHTEQTSCKGEEDGQKYFELSFPAADFTEVISKILSFGPDAKPISPTELVSVWQQKIKDMMKFIK